MSDLAGKTVWVVEPTDYDEYGICGIYDSLEAAKASTPYVKWIEDNDGSWIAEPTRHPGPPNYFRIYQDKIQGMPEPEPTPEIKTQRDAEERKRLRQEVRAPLPYEKPAA